METNLDINKLHLLEFKLIKGYVNSPFGFDQSAVKGHGFEVGFNMGFSLDSKTIKAEFTVNIETNSDSETEEQKADGNFEFVYIFRVENMDELIELSEDNTVIVNAHLANAVASVSYSTSRGILLARFQGTALADFIMPIIDPNALLEKDRFYKTIEDIR